MWLPFASSHEESGRETVFVYVQGSATNFTCVWTRSRDLVLDRQSNVLEILSQFSGFLGGDYVGLTDVFV